MILTDINSNLAQVCGELFCSLINFTLKMPICTRAWNEHDLSGLSVTERREEEEQA